MPLTRKVMLDEQKLLDLIDRMRVSIPEDVRTARRLVDEKSRIIDEAQSEAAKLKGEVESELRTRLQDDNFVKMAEQRAMEITMAAERQASAVLKEAEEESRIRREGADQYSLEVLQRLEGQLSVFLSSIQKGIGTIEYSLQPNPAADAREEDASGMAGESRRARRAGA